MPYLCHKQPYTFDINLSVALKGMWQGEWCCPRSAGRHGQVPLPPRDPELWLRGTRSTCCSLEPMWGSYKEKENARATLHSRGIVFHGNTGSLLCVCLVSAHICHCQLPYTAPQPPPAPPPAPQMCGTISSSAYLKARSQRLMGP